MSCAAHRVLKDTETKHEKTVKTEAIEKAISCYDKQINVLKQLSASKNNPTETSYKLALCIAKHGKSFTDEDFIKAAYLECSEVLFDGKSNKHMIISTVKDTPVSARTMEIHISEMAASL